MDKILFVCIGNMCRSPIAAAIGNKLLGHRYIFDCAGITSSGIPAAPYAVRVISELCNSDISTHRTKEVYLLELSDFKKIIVLDNYVYKNLLNFESSVQLILWDVPDPYSSNYEAYVSCAKSIEKLIKENFMDQKI